MWSLSDRDLAGVFSQKGAARGAGTLAITNRSVGIDQRSPDPSDYLLNPAAIDRPNEEFYKHSIRWATPPPPVSSTRPRARTSTPRARQSFPRELFNGVCGNCHGSVSGFEDDIVANPDILTRASEVVARDAKPVELGDRGDVSGPEFP